MSALRVLIVCEPMEYGVLSYLERLIPGLDRARVEPALAFSPHRLAPQGRRLIGELVGQQIRVRPLPFRRGIGPGDAVTIAHLVREVRTFRPDLLHLHSTKAGVVGRIVARLMRVPAVYTPHGTSWQYTGALLGRVQRGLERALRGATHGLISVCPEEASAFVREVGFPPARVRVVPNGVRVPDGDSVRAARERQRAALGLEPDARWLVFAGRLTREKGLDVLLQALSSDLGVDGLMVVGDGAGRTALAAAAARAPLPVRFCGYQEDVSPFLAAGDVFVAPSRSEGLPFSVLEAMAHGLPAVCADVGGVRTALGSCGILVPPEDPTALASALATLARDPALRRTLGEAARARAAREFGLPVMLAGIQDAYEESCGRGMRRRERAA